MTFGYGMTVLLEPETLFHARATFEIGDVGRTIAIPFLVKSFLTGGGLFLNIAGFESSRSFRIAGGFVGSCIWSWFLIKMYWIDDVAAIGFWFVVAALIASIRIIGMAWANLPRPGAPGAL